VWVAPTATTTTQPLPPPPIGTKFAGRRFAATSTPAKLSLLRAVAVFLAVVFAVGASFGVNRRANAIDDVRTAAGHLLALQDIRVSVVHADAIASSSYLVGGQEAPAQRTAYLDEVAKADDGLVAVSGAATAKDLEQLSEASRLLGSYVGLVEQARANNRQGFPVGAAYQRQANRIVSNADPDVPDIVSSLRAVEAAQRDQINASLATAHRAGVWLLLLGSLLMAVLLVGGLWISRAFRRLVNIPIAVAGAVLLLVLVIGGSAQSGAMNDVDGAVGRQLTSADNAAQARAAAFEARSQEALTLINRGNGAANEANWQTRNSIVLQGLDHRLGDSASQSTQAVDDYTSYRAAHAEIRALDDGGNWDQAVAVSLARQSTPNGIDAVATFNDFDQVVDQISTTEGSRAAQLIGDALGPMGRLRNIVFLAGLAIAALAALGCGQRLKEYR
jgi:CHASE3 domain sensor protein